MTNREKFLSLYTAALTDAVKNNPTVYTYGLDRVAGIAVGMVDAMARGNANLDSIAVKAACKQADVACKIGTLKAWLNEP